MFVIVLCFLIASIPALCLALTRVRVEFDDVGVKISRRKRRPPAAAAPRPDWTMEARYCRRSAGTHVVGFFDEAGDPVFYTFGDAYQADAVARWLSAGADDVRSLEEVLARAEKKRLQDEELERFATGDGFTAEVIGNDVVFRPHCLRPEPSSYGVSSALRDAYLGVESPPNPALTAKAGANGHKRTAGPCPCGCGRRITAASTWAGSFKLTRELR